MALGRDPIRTPSWVGLEGMASTGWSLVMGALLAGATVLTSRVLASEEETLRFVGVPGMPVQPPIRRAIALSP